MEEDQAFNFIVVVLVTAVKAVVGEEKKISLILDTLISRSRSYSKWKQELGSCTYGLHPRINVRILS